MSERELITKSEAIEIESFNSGEILCPTCNSELENIFHIVKISFDNYECPNCGYTSIFDDFYSEEY